MKEHASAASLASLVVARMTLGEKVGEVVLRSSGPYENVNSGVPRLCIPSLTLQDGPAGLAFGDIGVTQLPAPLGLAASFDPRLADLYGRIIGAEAAGQGIDVAQGPDLNLYRVPESGRGYEGLGEDPLLASAMGDAEIQGVQSEGVMADAKHFAVYSQEADRGDLDVSVSARALHELYLRPFESAVTQADVASLMCAYPRLEGTFQCQDPMLLQTLQGWGFPGFVRSDQGAVHDPAGAVKAGVDLLKPGSELALEKAVLAGSLPISNLDSAVETVLAQMFAYGLIGKPLKGTPGTDVATPAHAQLALAAAERSMVLLANRAGVLPLDASRLRSVAVIGADASEHPVTAGFGSAYVIPPFVSTPLKAIRSRLGPRVAIDYQPGASTTADLPLIPSSDLAPASGVGHGLTLSIGHLGGKRSSVSAVDPVSAASVRIQAVLPQVPNPVKPNPPAVHKQGSGAEPADRPSVSEVARRSRIDLPPTWGPSTVDWSGWLTVPRSGLYSFSLSGSGSAGLTLDGKVAVRDEVNHGSGTWSGTTNLVGGRRYRLALSWIPSDNRDGVDSNLSVGMTYDSDAIAAAAHAAHASQVAVVFAADYSGEAFDRPTLELPGDQDALIEAVSAANPRTVVVLNTEGPVLLPWLNRVAAVLEAWYPGEQDGAATAAILMGDVNPSGHLPVTFPSSLSASPVSSATQWPGVGLVSSYSEGLDVGYRYYNQTGTKPLFPFGYGLSYTTYKLSRQAVSASHQQVNVSMHLANTGARKGTDVIQVYVTFPAGSDEPPGQLAAFRAVTLAPGSEADVQLSIPTQQLATYTPSGWTVTPGRYTLAVEDSSANAALETSFTY